MSEQTKQRGPKKKHGPRSEYHLKFSDSVVAYMKSRSPRGIQVYIDELIAREMEQEAKVNQGRGVLE